MNSELKILKKFWQNNGEANIRLISKEVGFGLDYTRYICNCLFKKEKIKPVEGKRDCYELTSRGEKELKLRGIIKPKISKKAGDLVEKVTYYLPKKIKLGLLKPDPQERGIKKPKEILVPADEKKLNLGRAIEKAVSFLKRSIKEEK